MTVAAFRHWKLERPMGKFIELIDDNSGLHHVVDVERIVHVRTKRDSASTITSTITFGGGEALTVTISGGENVNAFRTALGLKPWEPRI
jgi:hypothetical protein